MNRARALFAVACVLLFALCPDPTTPRGVLEQEDVDGVIRSTETLDKPDATVVSTYYDNRSTAIADGEFFSHGVITIGIPAPFESSFLDWGQEFEIPGKPVAIVDLSSELIGGRPAEVCIESGRVRVFYGADLGGTDFRSAGWSFVAYYAAPADLTGDGRVDGADIATLLDQWGLDSSPADLNGDGRVDGADLAILLEAWG